MRVCCICEKKNSGYKCPSCRQSYCSAICCKKHKDDGCETVIQPDSLSEEAKKPTKQYDYPTEDTVDPEKLELLKESKDVKECLKNPHVQDIIKAILNDTDPTKAIGLAMTEPIFVELADACLKVVEPPDEEKPC